MSGSSAGQIVGAVAGGAIGFVVGGPAGAYYGASIGYTLGGIVDPPAGADVEGPRIDDKKITTSSYGDQIALVYGPTNRLSGSVIWSTDLIETADEEEGGKGGGGGGSSTTYTYRMSLAILLSARASTGVSRIWANSKLIYDASAATLPLPAVDPVNGQTVNGAFGTHAVFDELHFWPGSAVQVADPWIEAQEGAGQVPAYRRQTYCVLKDLQLADFGNRMPNIEFELAAEPSITVGAIATDICRRSGLGPVSVVHLQDQVRGYVVGRSSNGSGALAPLAMAYHFDIAEYAGQVRCIRRGRSMVGTIPTDQMGGREANALPSEPAEFDTASAVGLPREVTVRFSDPALDYQGNAQRAFRDRGDTEANEEAQLPLTLTADEGRRIADRLLWSPWSARRGAKFSTSDRWVRSARPGALLGIEVAGQVLPYRVLRATRGDNGVVDWEVQRDDSQVYESNATGVAGNLSPNPLRLPGDTVLVLMDMPIIQDTDDNTGFYWAATGELDGWRGAIVWRSTDAGDTYQSVSGVSVRSRLGYVASALPAGPTAYWDDGNTLTVTMAWDGETLDSRTEAAVLNGANGFWLGPATGQGGEVVQFRDALLISPGVYQLSGLLRGRLGTEANVGTHGADEVFVLLSTLTAGRSDFGAGDWAAERLYKPVSNLQSIDDTASQAFTNTGVGKRPYSPVHVLGVRDGSNNLDVSWVRRSRLRSQGLAGPVPMGEASEAYEVDIHSGATVVRTITSSTPTISYTAAQQTADGLTPGNPVTLRVYQMSGVAGRGFPAIATV